MAQDPTKANEKTISPHLIYWGFVVTALAVAGLVHFMPQSFKLIMNDKYGVYENLTILFYGLAIGLAARNAWQRRAQGWKSWGLWAGVAILAAIFIGEEFRWGIPFFYDDFREWPVISIQSMLARSYEGVPEGASMKMIAMIAGIRILGILSMIYALMGAVYYRRRISAYVHSLRKQRSSVSTDPRIRGERSFAILYAAVFVGFFVGSIVMDAEIIPGRRIFEECFEMLAAAAYVMGILIKGKV